MALRALDLLAGRLHNLVDNLRASERRYRLLCERSPAGMFRTRLRDAQVLYANPAAIRMLGYRSLAEVQTHRAADFYADPAELERNLKRLEDEGGALTIEVDFRRKDGRVMRVLISAVRLLENDEVYVEGQFIERPATTGGSAS